ncbi:MAG: carboxylesterase family protein [Acidimicrobiia bacterium]|nr:carboxylesterase family protein [Acidimicrobiia bacterium]
MHGTDVATTTAECPAGELTGLDRGPTMVFKGIRFAAANRFAEPIDETSLHRDGTARPYDATRFRAQAPQLGGTLETLLGGSRLPTDEDCHHLNIFTPGCDENRRPVLFWVHGGAYNTGGGAMPWYDGSRLAERGDVVVVTINYRLGAFGFLGDRNSGLLDQVSALRWVARNIAGFGGDPENVTLFGESAGGSAVIALSAMSGADSLFHRALAMSPSIMQYRSLEVGRQLERSFLDELGVNSVGPVTQMSTEQLLDAQAALLAAPTKATQHFTPTELTSTIPGPILDASERDARPLVIGTTRDEATLFTGFDPRRHDWNAADVERQFRRVFEDGAPRAIEAYRDARPGADANRLVCALETDAMFTVSARRLAERRALVGGATWMYLFDQETPQFGGVLGSCHALDIPFAFDNLHRPGVDAFVGTAPGRQQVADRFAEAVVSFACTGEPGWQPYDLTSRTTQRIGPEPAAVSDPGREIRMMWETVERGAPVQRSSA